MTIEERKEIARRLHPQGFNCSQCVALAFADRVGIDREALSAITSGFGGGVGGCGEICGAVSGASAILGMAEWHAPQDKKMVYAAVSALAEEFRQRNGALRCSDLKGDAAHRKPCMQYIEDAIELLNDKLETL